MLCAEFLGPEGHGDYPSALGGWQAVRAVSVQASGLALSIPPHTPGCRAAKGRSFIRGNRPLPEIICLQTVPRGELTSLQPEEQIACILQCVPFNFTNISPSTQGREWEGDYGVALLCLLSKTVPFL